MYILKYNFICEDCGLPKGEYFYGNAKSVAEAKKEAEYFISILSGKKYEYPVFYDVEGRMITDNDRATLTEIVKAILFYYGSSRIIGLVFIHRNHFLTVK